MNRFGPGIVLGRVMDSYDRPHHGAESGAAIPAHPQRTGFAKDPVRLLPLATSSGRGSTWSRAPSEGPLESRSTTSAEPWAPTRIGGESVGGLSAVAPIVRRGRSIGSGLPQW